MRKVESGVEVRPVGANVLIEGRCKTSVFNIQNAKLNPDDVFTWSVIGVGADVREEIQVGQTVVLHSAPTVPINVTSNDIALYKLRRLVLAISNRDLEDLRKISSVLEFTQHFIVPEAYIVAISDDKFKSEVDMKSVVKFLNSCEKVEVNLPRGGSPSLNLVK